MSEIPFDSQRKAMSVVVQESSGAAALYAKGAPEVILQMCRCELRGGAVRELTAERRAELAACQAAMAGRALRVLAFSFRDQVIVADGVYSEDDQVFLGLVGMTDPPRQGVREAIQRCRAAGIRPIMITGDHPLTARAIGLELQLIDSEDHVLTGQELAALPAVERDGVIARTKVFARVLAEHKLAIVSAWQGRGEIVAMTGDGVNDAPAVKAADVGIAMGLTGTDVTKEAADVILTDDNFTSIVSAVEEGRGIYDNIQKFVLYLLACNSGEVLFVFFAAMAGFPSPLTAVQLLWINLVTDGLPALALGLEAPEPDIMQRPPRPPSQRLITRSLALRIIGQGLLLGATSFAAFSIVYARSEGDLASARTVAFCVAACAQLFFSFACRSQRYTLPQLGLFSNPYLCGAIALSLLMQVSAVAAPGLQIVFDATNLSPQEWALALILSLTPVTLVELPKLVVARARQRAASLA